MTMAAVVLVAGAAGCVVAERPAVRVRVRVATLDALRLSQTAALHRRRLPRPGGWVTKKTTLVRLVTGEIHGHPPVQLPLVRKSPL